MALTVAPSTPLCYTYSRPHVSMSRGNLLSAIKNRIGAGSKPAEPRHHYFQERSIYTDDPDMGHGHSRQTTSSGALPTRRNTGTTNSRSQHRQMDYQKTIAEVAPPAYTASPDAAVQTTDPEADDPYAFLSSFDTVFLIDDSGSMAGRSWRETKDALETIIPVCVQHDADGIDINFLNAEISPWHHNVTSPATVREIFSAVQPRGSTPTGQRLSAILKPYLRRCEGSGGPDAVKPLNLIVITDGVPTDDVESAIIWAARKLDKLEAPAWQVGIQFFQVGNDESARQHLKQLDDELSEIAGGDGVRDMVDTVPFKSSNGAALTGDGILKVVLGAVNRRLDRSKSKDLHR